jgi:hypothetical protein
VKIGTGKNMTADELWKIFCWGVDYGQLLMEKEWENEEWGDAFQGYIISNKYNMPSDPAPRRQLHSEKWFEAKNKSYLEFVEFYINYAQAKAKVDNKQKIFDFEDTNVK